MGDYLEWKIAFSDPICVKILIYLAKYNPDVPKKSLLKELNVSEQIFDKKINLLVTSDLVKIEKDFFTLTDYGRIGLKNLVQLSSIKSKD